MPSRSRGLALALALGLSLALSLGHVPAACASALLSPRNLTAPGDRLLTFDARTGLEWLALTQTHRTPASQILLDLAPGAPLAGWRTCRRQACKNMRLSGTPCSVRASALL